MHRAAASLRHWELTQELFDIGDEVAGYVENLAEATRDFDGELAAECLTEFDEIVDEANAGCSAITVARQPSAAACTRSLTSR